MLVVEFTTVSKFFVNMKFFKLLIRVCKPFRYDKILKNVHYPIHDMHQILKKVEPQNLQAHEDIKLA